MAGTLCRIKLGSDYLDDRLANLVMYVTANQKIPRIPDLVLLTRTARSFPFRPCRRHPSLHQL